MYYWRRVGNWQPWQMFHLFDNLQFARHDFINVSKLLVGFSQFFHLAFQLFKPLTLVDQLTVSLIQTDHRYTVQSWTTHTRTHTYIHTHTHTHTHWPYSSNNAKWTYKNLLAVKSLLMGNGILLIMPLNLKVHVQFVTRTECLATCCPFLMELAN